MNEDLKKLELEAVEAINSVETEHNLNEVKALYLGKKSKLQGIMSQTATRWQTNTTINTCPWLDVGNTEKVNNGTVPFST